MTAHEPDAEWDALDRDPLDGHAPDCTVMPCCCRPSCEPHREDCPEAQEPDE
jgi:hypothetical protein